MARINLLPWREERRRQRQKEFGVMLGLGAVAGVVLWFLVNGYYNAQIAGQGERNEYVRQQIEQVKLQNQEIEELERQKSRLLARKQVIEELQANRSQMVHLFDSLVRTVPDGVTLSSIQQEGTKLTLTGRSQSNARVSTYMRNLEGSGWMRKPDLSIIEAKDGIAGLPYTFTLAVDLANPNAPLDEDGDGVPDEPVAVVPAPMPAPMPAVAAETVAPAATPAPDAAPTPEAAPAPAPASETAPAPAPDSGDAS